MNRLITHFFALLLIPALVADPAFAKASAGWPALAVSLKNPLAPLEERVKGEGDAFQEQALAEPPVASQELPGDLEAAKLRRAEAAQRRFKQPAAPADRNVAERKPIIQDPCVW